MNKIVIIHPGSQYLRIGLASDNPITILNVIGRRKCSTSAAFQEAFLPPVDTWDEFDTHVAQAMATYLSPSIESQIDTTTKQVDAFNKQSVPEEIRLLEDKTHDTEDNCIDDEGLKRIKLGNTENESKCSNNDIKEVIFDTDILKLDTGHLKAEYNIHFPMRRGELNLHQNIGGTLSSVLADLESIWLYAIHERLGIAKGALNQYNAVLVIPDIYNRSNLKELVTLLLQRLQFRACFLLQDHVASTFGAGLSYACVVDIGHEKSSISCVEDGISHPDTRVHLSYGGGDITQVFYKLLCKNSFPYRECNVVTRMSDAILISKLKEDNCHVNAEVWGASEKSFEVRKAHKILNYPIKFGIECLVAPLSIFHIELLNITGKQKQARIQLQSSQQNDPEDCFDTEYISETGRRNGGRDHLMMDGSSLLSMGAGGDVVEDDLVVDDVSERDAYSWKLDAKEEMVYMPNGQILPLDQAIIRSIERCPNDEIKRKMHSSILLVGGSAKFPGLSTFLEKQISLHMLSQRSGDQQAPFEVNVLFKEMDSRIIAWKGAAIMSCLESAPELWIFKGEWEKAGLRVLREKAPFNW